MDLRACLHGVGNPGLVGLVSFVFTLWGTQNKRNLPTRPGSPTPCKQGLKYILFTPTILYNHCYQFLLGITAVPREIEDNVCKILVTNKVHYGVWENSELYHLCLLLNNAS